MTPFEPMTEAEMADAGLTYPEPPVESDDDYEARLHAERRINVHLETMRDRAEAQRRFKAEQAGAFTLPAAVTLDAFLAIPDEPVKWRVHGLWAVGGHNVVAAQFKAGKTTLMGNLIRVLVDGGAFLGKYQTEPVQRVALIDNEMDERTLREWLRAQGIHNTAAVLLIPIRGKVSSFNIIDDTIRAQWADLIRGADVVVLDCLRPVLDALGLDENKDAGRFLVAFDALLKECGASEATIVHHMGHSGERSRGDSRILDWPDATWKLVRQNDDPDSPRYFSAYGRDVNEPETLLEFEAEGRRLTSTEGNRTANRVSQLVDEVVSFVTVNPGVSKTGIRDGLPGDNKDISRAVDQAVTDGKLIPEKRIGRGGGTAYRATAAGYGTPTPIHQPDQKLPAA
jgi:hypothetical protein